MAIPRRRATVPDRGKFVRSQFRVLIADDNASVRVAMRQVLEAAEQGWEIVEAGNGQEAVARAGQFRPDLVILDLVMPVMDGLAASREIAKMLPTVPILMHTLHSTPQLESEAGKFGIRRVVPKSDSIGLVSVVQEVLDSKSQAPSEPEPGPASSETGTTLRRTEDRIRELCARLFATDKNETEAGIVVDLQTTLHQHIQQLRRRLTEYPVIVERRVRNRIPLPEMLTDEKPTKESNSLVSNGVATAMPTSPGQVQPEEG